MCALCALCALCVSPCPSLSILPQLSNHHMHGHLKDTILDFGGVYSVWTMAAERLHGVLGQINTNHHDMEVQLMRHMVELQRLMRLPSRPDCLLQLSSEARDIVDQMNSQSALREDTSLYTQHVVQLSSLSVDPDKDANGSEPLPGFSVKSLSHESLTQGERAQLQSFYRQVYSEDVADIENATHIIDRFGSFEVAGAQFGSVYGGSEREAYVIARFHVGDQLMSWPGRVDFYFHHTIRLRDSSDDAQVCR